MPDGPEQQVADRLDADVDALLAGRRPAAAAGADPVLAALASLREPPAPAAVRDAVARVVRLPRRSRPWRLVRVAAALAAAGFFSQGVVAVFASEWLADLLHAPHAPHVTREGGLAAFAIAVLLSVAVARPRLIESAMVAAVPLGVALGVYGATEIPHLENPAGEYFHLSQAVSALFLLGAWLAARRADAREAPGARDAAGPRGEGEQR